MKATFAIALGLVALLVSAGGYWAGFREGWETGLRADAAPRGVIALRSLELIERGRMDIVRTSLEHDVDMGLIHWHDLSKSPTAPLIDALSGGDVAPGYEKFVRRLAVYRRTNPSALNNPETKKSLIESAAKVDPDFAVQLDRGIDDSRRALDEMVARYGK